MNSAERHDARYQRRKANRMDKRKKLSDANDIRKIFAQKNLRESFRKCKRCLSWKGSVQKYIVRYPVITAVNHKKLMSWKFRHSKFTEFSLFERGKKRDIKAIKFNDRVVQRCLCDNSITPVICRSFIYDNGASQKYKGYHFAMDRLKAHLQKHYRKHGNEGYILLFDFSKFFDNVSHKVLSNVLRKKYDSMDVVAFIEGFIAMFGEKGLGLGSQISQIMSLASADELDHFVKDRMRVKFYARYMDDGYVIHESKEYLEKLLEGMKEICIKLEMNMNVKKTRIEKLSHGFTWLKARWNLTKSGKVVKKIYKHSITVMRRKLKKYRQMINDGRFNLEHVAISYSSWKGYAGYFHAYHNMQSMDKLYKELYPDVPKPKNLVKKTLSRIKYTWMKLSSANSLNIPDDRKRYIRKCWLSDARSYQKHNDVYGIHEWNNFIKALEKEAA